MSPHARPNQRTSGPHLDVAPNAAEADALLTICGAASRGRATLAPSRRRARPQTATSRPGLRPFASHCYRAQINARASTYETPAAWTRLGTTSCCTLGAPPASRPRASTSEARWSSPSTPSRTGRTPRSTSACIGLYPHHRQRRRLRPHLLHLRHAHLRTVSPLGASCTAPGRTTRIRSFSSCGGAKGGG